MISTIIVLCILAFMVVGLLTHFLPYGVVGMICCAAFVLTGVTSMSTAFSGLSSSTTILVACMIVVASQLGRTSIIARLKKVMERFQGKKGIFLLIPFFLVTILLAQLMGQIACLSLLLMFAQSLDDEGDTTPSRVFFAICVVNTLWTSKLPFGMGATMPGTINSFYQGLVTPDQMLGIADYCKAGLIPGLLGLAYCIAFYKLIPNSRLNSDSGTVVKTKEVEKISTRDEGIILAVFIVVTLGFMFQNYLGSDVTNVIPVAAVLVMIVTKVTTLQSAVHTLTGDMVWMIASMQTMSTVLSETGVGELIGTTVLRILGDNPSALLVAVVLCVSTSIMTNFLSNLGAMAVMTPIAASIALAGGMNVQALVLIVSVSAWFAILLPTASPGALMAFSISGQNPMKALRFTLPLFVVEMVSLVLSINIFFPIYG